ncbi:MAG: SDR family NAD(P)-dependent oxidoreductase [Chloroflexi bacterium]|nr:SDR family NAD(P)-dependent oxidoreductase [Chloroflexota bacterium]
MDLGIQGKVALVTGGSRGLGRVAALSLAREGVNVAICGRTQSTLDGTVAEIEALGVRGQGVVADVSDSEAMPALNQAVVDGLGAIDILVNNAGGSRAREDLADLPLDDFKAAFDLNLFGGFQLMREVIPHMRAQKWGRIINIASIYGREYGGNLAYMSAKAALIGATKHAALSLVTDGVLVNSIAPGSIEHPEGSWERFQNENPPEVVADFISRNLPLGRFGWPEPVGDLVAFLASQRADLITGSCIVVDGGQSYSMI